jgi:choice-of-anchor B domain-containing protein
MNSARGSIFQTRYILTACLIALAAAGQAFADDLDFSYSGVFPASNITLADRKTPSQLGFTDGPIMADLWGWTDPDDGREYIIATADAVHAPSAISGAEQAALIHQPMGGVAFARLNPEGEIQPLGVWRHPDIPLTDHGDVQVFANHAYVSGEAVGYGLVIFDLTLLRNRVPCTSATDCANTLLNAVNGFAVVKTTLTDTSGRAVSISDSHNLTIDETSGLMAIHAAGTFKEAAQGKRRERSTKILRIDPANPKDPLLLHDLRKASHDGLIVRYWGPDTAHQGKRILLLANGYKHTFVAANFIEVFNNPKNGLSIFQLTKPDGETLDIKQISRVITYDNDDFGHQLALSEDHRYAFFNDEAQTGQGGSARQIVYDVQSLKKPFVDFQCFHIEESVSHDAYVLGDYLFSGNYTSGLRVTDISSAENGMCIQGRLNEIAYIDTEPRLNKITDELTFEIAPGVVLKSFSDFAGVWGNYPYFESGFIIVSDFFNGVFAVRLDMPD